MQIMCGYECAHRHIAHLMLKKATKEAKADRKETKARLEAIKTKPQLLKEAQIEFNRFIRLRDVGRPCICCGVSKPISSEAFTGGSVDAGHYRSVGSAPHLRFNEDNVHAQNKLCNRWGAGRAVDYRIGLIQRIGLDRVEALEADQTAKHYTRDEIRAIRDKYRAKANELKASAKD